MAIGNCLLIHVFYCIQGAYATIQMDTSNITVTDTAMCRAELQYDSDSAEASPSFFELLHVAFHIQVWKSNSRGGCSVCKCAV